MFHPGYVVDPSTVYEANLSVRELFIEADPFAAAFYEHQGARLVGERPSSAIPGRVLPLYSLDVSLFA